VNSARSWLGTRIRGARPLFGDRKVFLAIVDKHYKGTGAGQRYRSLALRALLGQGAIEGRIGEKLRFYRHTAEGIKSFTSEGACAQLRWHRPLSISVGKDLRSSRIVRGGLVAKLLRGAWRFPSLSPTITVEELGEIRDLLLEFGAAPLAWWRIRRSVLIHTPAASRLHTAYRMESLKGAQREIHLRPLLKKFRTRGIDPILMKGCSLARLYPENGLRPYNDVDLIVPGEQVEAALSVISDERNLNVDLEHDQITRFDRRTWNDLYHRSRMVPLAGIEIRVLSAEDELRAQCIHFLKHGGCGPLSLCDIALLVESREPNFDWDVCLGVDRKRRSWIACALLLAHNLLGMKWEGVPLDFTPERLPKWVSATVLEQWGKIPRALQAEVRSSLRRPATIAEAIAERWPPNPIVATLTSGACFGAWPAPVLQVADAGLRFTRWLLAGARTVPSQQGIETECA